MDILIFDMDGVLLEARGYHRALQDTVIKAAEYLQLDGIELSQEDIYRFESLGISSEWHSSALCMAFLEIQLKSELIPSRLDLDEIFIALEDQPFHNPARQRGLSALELISNKYGVDPDKIKARLMNSEDINESLTLNWFQELVLGSNDFQERYQKLARLKSPSYLQKFDIPILTPAHASRIAALQDTNNCGVAVMTNRPSVGPADTSGSPEAEYGLRLIGLEEIPLIGFGEISWLAENVCQGVEELLKPNPTHALAAIFSAIGVPVEESLFTAVNDLSMLDQQIIDRLTGKAVAVFEDTPPGVKAVQHAGEMLREAGVDIYIYAYGIAREESKIKALNSVGAEVFPEINAALIQLKDF